MTREAAETFMFGLKNYQWLQHPLLYEHVDLGIKMIYDDIELGRCENCNHAMPSDNDNIICPMLGLTRNINWHCGDFEGKDNGN